MKRNFSVLLSFFCITLLILCTVGCGANDKKTTDSPLSSVAEGDTVGEPLHLGNLTEFLKIESLTDSEGNKCKVVQGGCAYDGYAYIALNDGNSQSTDSVSAINKYDLESGELVESYTGIRSSHCNDMTVNGDTGELIITHNTPDLTNISIFDLATMEYKETRTLALEIYGIVYDPYERCYWVGISRGYNYARLDLDFNVSGDIIKGEIYGSIRQGMTVDAERLYFVRYLDNGIIAYDKETKSSTRYHLSVTSAEAECIFFDGGELYVGYYTGNGGVLYKAELTTRETLAVGAECSGLSLSDPYTDSEGNRFSVPQGSCSDGEFLYVMLSNNDKQAYRSVLMKIDPESGDTLSVTEGFEVGLANDLTYNPKTGEIIVVHNSPTPDKVTFIDADTLEVTRKETLGLNIYALAYNSTEDVYYAGISNCYDFAKLDAELRQAGTLYPGYPSGYTRQGMDCDGRYIYFLLSEENSIAIYRTDGSLVNIVTLPSGYGKAQSICHTKDSFYLIYQLPDERIELYKLQLSIGK